MKPAAAQSDVSRSSVARFGSTSDWLRLVGLAAILVIVVSRCVISFSPIVAFDGDPASDFLPLFGLSQGGSMTLDGVLLLACAFSLIAERCSGRDLNWLVLLLAVLPAPIVLMHGWHDAGNMFLGSAWLVAACACATIAHLARDRRLRVIAASVLLATLLPMISRGALQVWYEHAHTIAHFEANKQQFLLNRGWEPESAAAQLFERRLRQPQPLGWFATTNILASFVACGMVAFVGLAIAAIKQRLQGGWAAAMILLAAAATTTLVLSGSKGAIVAAGMGLVVLALQMVWKLGSMHIGRIVMALIALSLIGVFIRGAVLPESFAGEKSLLFRWHYMTASAQILSDQPWLGTGPDRFQDAYILHRPQRSPEEVTSAHSMFWDWLCTLGIVGGAWIAMMIALMVRRLEPDANAQALADHVGETSSLLRATIAVVGAVMVVGFVPAIALEWGSIDDVAILSRALGVLGFAVAAMLVMHISVFGAWHAVRAAMMAAIAALIVHGQIEMTFTQPGAAVWALCGIGVAFPLRECSIDLKRRCRISSAGVVAAALAAVVVWFQFTWVWTLPAWRQEHAMTQAAAQLHAAAGTDAAALIAARRQAAEALAVAYDLRPANVQPLNAAADQLERAYLAVRTAAMQQNERTGLDAVMIQRASDLIERAIRDHNRSSSLVLATGIDVRLVIATHQEAIWKRAIERAREMTQRDPNGIGSWRRLGDVLWFAPDSGLKSEAVAAYRRALECNANFELDPVKQLSDAQRNAIQQRIDAATRD